MPSTLLVENPNSLKGTLNGGMFANGCSGGFASLTSRNELNDVFKYIKV
jgi:hypothetical protein